MMADAKAYLMVAMTDFVLAVSKVVSKVKTKGSSKVAGTVAKKVAKKVVWLVEKRAVP